VSMTAIDLRWSFTSASLVTMVSVFLESLGVA